MDDNQLLRYSRHIFLDDVDVGGQQAFLDAHVLIVGAGGLGCPAAMYLASSGVGRLTLVDDDKVELSNLQRQIAHTEARIGQSKVASLKTQLQQINSDCEVLLINQRIDAQSFAPLLENVDIVLDCTDNFGTRFMLNEQCFKKSVPLVSGAAIRQQGQVAVYNFKEPASACYRCLYSDQQQNAESCSETGVLAPIVGVVGAYQAMLALQLLLGQTLLPTALQVFDFKQQAWRKITLPKDADCPVCKKQ